MKGKRDMTEINCEPRSTKPEPRASARAVSPARKHRATSTLHFGVACVVTLLCAGCAVTPAATLYVAPNGEPEWSGTLAAPNANATDGPLPSIRAARDRIRAQRTRGKWTDEPITVRIRGGTYFLDETFAIGPEDSGKPGIPVTYAAHEKEKPVISGGRPITGWRTVQVNGKTAWAVDIPDVKAGKWYFRQLFVSGKRRPRTRLPRTGFHEFTGLPQMKPDTKWSQGQTEATFKPGDISKWKNLSDVEVVALHFWIQSRLPIADVDESANLAKFTRKSTFRLTDAHNLEKFARYYIENVFEALDQPGEWYLDRAAGTLYYIPMPGENPDNTTVIAPRLEQLVRVIGKPDGSQPVLDVDFEGLTFCHADWSLPDDDAGSVQASFEVPGALFFQRTGQCDLRNCTVSHVSSYAIEYNVGCENGRIDNCTLTDLGAGGVKFWHNSKRNTVHNCEIGPGGHIFHSAIGVWIGGSGENTVTHNHIHHFYYTGVSVGWSWGFNDSPAIRNVVEYNHIHDIGQGFLSDMGGIYTLGVSPGTRLRYNLIHDIEAHTYGGWGLYTDEGSSYILLENNVVYRCKHNGFHQHYGSYNVVKNNIFAFGRHAQIRRSREEEHTSFIFERNIVYGDTPTVLGNNWKNDNYHLDHNVYWRKGGQPMDFAGGSFEDWQKRGHDRHSIIADPLFKDPDNGNFTLDPKSPALKMGFKPIDTSKIGRLKTP